MDFTGHVFILVAADLGVIVITIFIIADLGLQRAAAGDGHIAVGDMQGRAAFGENLVVSLQRDVRAGAAHVDGVAAAADVYILNGDVCRRIAGGINGDGAAGSGCAVALLDDRRVVRNGCAAALRYRLPGTVCTYGDVAVLQIPVCGKHRHGQTCHQHKRNHARQESFQFHWINRLLPCPNPYPAGWQLGDCIGTEPNAMGYPIAIPSFRIHAPETVSYRLAEYVSLPFEPNLPL